jgi:hypothetical protein
VSWNYYKECPTKNEKTGMFEVVPKHVDWDNEGADFLSGTKLISVDQAACVPRELLVSKSFTKKQLAILDKRRGEINLLLMTKNLKDT